MDRHIAHSIQVKELAKFQEPQSWTSLYALAGTTRSEQINAPDGTPLLLEIRFVDKDGDIHIEGSIDSASHWRMERLEEKLVVNRHDVMRQISKHIIEKNIELYRRLADS